MEERLEYMPMNRDNLITDNMNLVYYVCHKNFPTFIHNEDIIQEGMIGLIKAAETYNPDKTKFSTYAYRCILNSMNNYLAKERCDVELISLDNTIKGKNDSESLISELIEDVNSQTAFNDIEYDSFGETLSEKQKVVYDLLKQGKTRHEIGVEFGISASAVTATVKRIRKKWRAYCNGNQD